LTKIVKTITFSTHSKRIVLRYRTIKKIFISWHYPFKESIYCTGERGRG